MKKEDVKIGMKVVPLQKTAGTIGLMKSVVWERAEEKNQPYLFVNGKEESYFYLSDIKNNYGDFFNAEDFKPYVETPKEKYTIYNYEILPCEVKGKVFDVKHNFIQNQTFNAKAPSYKLVFNGLTTIVILDNGVKGIAKCNPNDKFDRDLGYDIAYKRAIIEDQKRELEKLIH